MAANDSRNSGCYMTSSHFYVFDTRHCRQRHYVFGLSNLDETYKEYSLAPTDDLVRLHL